LSSFVDHGDHDVWSASSFLDLEEWVLVTKTLLTGFTVVEIFADAAFVTDAFDWGDSRSITFATEYFFL